MRQWSRSSEWSGSSEQLTLCQSAPPASNADQYLGSCKKTKGVNCSDAAKTFHVGVCPLLSSLILFLAYLKVAAEEAKVWGRGLTLSDITIHDRVKRDNIITGCPLKGHTRDIDNKLRRVLNNSNHYKGQKKVCSKIKCKFLVPC